MLYICLLNQNLLQSIAIIFFVAVGIQFIFLSAFLYAFTRIRIKKNFTAPVSVIVCAHDEEENLKELVPLLLAQNHPDFEVIIVDDRSNDMTFDFLLQETKKDSRLKRVNVDHLPKHVDGKKYALTLGIKAAKNEWILLTDADCRPEGNDWISTMTTEASDETTFILGYSPYLSKPGFLNKFIRFESLITAIQYIGFAIMRMPYMAVGRNLAYRKSFFLKHKGFNDLMHITGGDDDLFINHHANGKNTAVCISAESLMHSVPKTTLKSFITQKVRHLSVGKRYKFKHRLVLGLFTLSWMLCWFFGLPLLFIFTPFYVIALALALRLIMLIVTIHTSAKRLNQKFEVGTIIFLDLIFCVYYISIGLVAFFTKKVQWRN